MSAPTIICTWTEDGVFKPLARHAKQCDEVFCIGAEYFVDAKEPRSEKTHRHYFVTLHEIWQSLPDDMAERCPSVESLRKKALIHCGYATREDIVCSTPEMALRLSAIARRLDEYCIVRVDDCTVAIWRAKSQDRRSMDKAQFAESKERVLSWCAGLIGVDPAAIAEPKRLSPPREDAA